MTNWFNYSFPSDAQIQEISFGKEVVDMNNFKLPVEILKSGNVAHVPSI